MGTTLIVSFLRPLLRCQSSFKQIVSTGLRNATQAAGSIVSMYMTSAYLTNVLVGLIAGVIVVGNTFGRRQAALFAAELEIERIPQC